MDHRRRRRERRKLRWELLLQQRQQQTVAAPRRLEAHPYQGTLSLSTVRQLPRLALLRHTQLQLWWETPRPLLTAGRYMRLRQRHRVEIHRLGQARTLRRTKGWPRRGPSLLRRQGKIRPEHRRNAAVKRRRGRVNTRKGKYRVVRGAAALSRRRTKSVATSEATASRSSRLSQRLRRARARRLPLVSSLKLLRRLDDLSTLGSRLEDQAHPIMALRFIMGRLLRLQRRCGYLRRKAAQSYGYIRYKANFFGQKNRQRLRQLFKKHCSTEALRQRQRCIARTLAQLDRQGRRCLYRLESQLGWEKTGPREGAVTRTPRLVWL